MKLIKEEATCIGQQNKIDMAASKWRICTWLWVTYFTVNAGRSFPAVPCQLLLHPSQRTPCSLPSSGQRGGSLSRGIMVQGQGFFCVRKLKGLPVLFLLLASGMGVYPGESWCKVRNSSTSGDPKDSYVYTIKREKENRWPFFTV